MYQPSGLQNISIKEVWECFSSDRGNFFEAGMGGEGVWICQFSLAWLNVKEFLGFYSLGLQIYMY